MLKEELKYSISQVSENSFLLKYKENFSNKLSIHIAKCAQQIDRHFGDLILNTIPSYDALLISFQPYARDDFLPQIEEIIQNTYIQEATSSQKTIVIPTYYDVEVAEQLDEILSEMGISKEEMISMHTSARFFVYMIGFCPGFAYMGDLPKKMRLARRKTPQLKIPSSSVAIADFQTAIYPLEMPGGWHIIGKTPLEIFNTKRSKPSLFKQGDRVQFKSIGRKEFIELGGKI